MDANFRPPPKKKKQPRLQCFSLYGKIHLRTVRFFLMTVIVAHVCTESALMATVHIPVPVKLGTLVSPD